MAENEQGSGPKGKGHKLLLVLGIVLILCLNLLVAGKVFLGGKGGPSKSEKSTVEEVGASLSLEEFLVNVAGSNDHYLKTTLALGLKKGVTEKSLEEKIPLIRDTILSILSSKSLEELSSERGRSGLKQEIKERLNKELGGEQIVKVYFTAFATQ
jgi:flagellar FliL protein